MNTHNSICCKFGVFVVELARDESRIVRVISYLRIPKIVWVGLQNLICVCLLHWQDYMLSHKDRYMNMYTHECALLNEN